MHHRRRRTVSALSAFLGMLSGGCGEAGLSAPRDPGTVRVSVRDELSAPVPGAGVRVEMPNNSGGVFEVGVSTRADGSATVSGVPAGSRRVTVTPPAGYSPGTEPPVRLVDVVKGQTVQVSFVLRRGTGATRTAGALLVQPSDGAVRRTGDPWRRRFAPRG